MIRIVLFFGLVMMLFCGCQSPELSKKEMREILHQQNEKLAEFFKAGDAEKLSAMYSDSAKLCPDEENIYIGRNAIAHFWSRAMEGGKLTEMTTETLTVDGNREMIYETGKTTSKVVYKDTLYVTKVKFANVWRRQSDGSYLLDVDIWNDLPEEE